MRTLTVATAVALICGATAFGASQISYELNLGGDNHYLDWENYENPAFTPGTPADGAVYDCDAIDCTGITWDALVTVAGAHSTDSFDTSGATCLVFDVELRDDQGAVVGDVTFYSTMNDGDADGLRGIIEGKPDPLEMAAFCLIFGQDDPNAFEQPAIAGFGPPNAPGRAFDDDASGGPFMRRAQFPTVGAHGGGRLDQAGNHVAGGTPSAGLSNGKLIGMGCGYPQFKSVETGGKASAGVGIDPFDWGIICQRGLGQLSVVEGQMDLSQLPTGDYKLVITPGVGNNIMPGSYDCQLGAEVAFAEAADEVLGDEINFSVLNEIDECQPVAQAWSSVVDHTGVGALRIPLDDTATGAAVTTEPRLLPDLGAGVLGMTIEVDFDSDITACILGDAAVTGGATVASQVVINGGTTLQINLSGAVDQTCYTIDLSAAVDGVTGAVDCSVITLNGDSNDDQVCSSFDRAQLKAAGGTPVTEATARTDVNSDGVNSSFDRALGKAAGGNAATCP